MNFWKLSSPQNKGEVEKMEKNTSGKKFMQKKLTVRNCKGCRIKLCLTFAQLSARDIVAI